MTWKTSTGVKLGSSYDLCVAGHMPSSYDSCFHGAPSGQLCINRQGLEAESGSADVKVIAIAVGDSKSSVETFKKQFKTLFPILPDEDGEIARSMPGLTTPTTMIISSGDARVLFTHRGLIDDADGFIKQVKFVKQLETWDKKSHSSNGPYGI